MNDIVAIIITVLVAGGICLLAYKIIKSVLLFVNKVLKRIPQEISKNKPDEVTLGQAPIAKITPNNSVVANIVMAVIAVGMFWYLFSGDPEPQVKNQKTQQAVWIEQSKEAVQARLKDPKSAEFKEVFFNDANGTPMVCGQINSKNGLGGYTGYQHFVASGNKLAFFERETSDFTKVWGELCTK